MATDTGPTVATAAFNASSSPGVTSTNPNMFKLHINNSEFLYLLNSEWHICPQLLYNTTLIYNSLHVQINQHTFVSSANISGFEMTWLFFSIIGIALFGVNAMILLVIKLLKITSLSIRIWIFLLWSYLLPERRKEHR